MNPGRRLFFCSSVVEYLLRGSIGMEMKRSYGFTRRKECWLSLYGRECKILLQPKSDGKFSDVAHERQLPRSLYFARQRSRRRSTAGGQSNCGVPFFSSKEVTKLSVGLGGNQKEENLARRRRQIHFFHICRISFDGPHWAVIDVVFQKRKAACICFGANGKKTK